jgi:ABC-type multidrug transport system fused ATPase/permease subunit
MSVQRIESGPRMSQAVIHNKTVYLAGQVAENREARASRRRRRKSCPASTAARPGPHRQEPFIERYDLAHRHGELRRNEQGVGVVGRARRHPGASHGFEPAACRPRLQDRNLGDRRAALSAPLKVHAPCSFCKTSRKSFENRSALTDVNLTVPKGATHALIGSSGSGKTTLLRITLGLIPMDKGYVKINDKALSSFTPTQWADRIGYVPQDGGLFPHISGRNNVADRQAARLGQGQIDARIEELSKLVDLDAAMLARFPPNSAAARSSASPSCARR